MNRAQIVITGMGSVTPIGIGTAATWDALLAGVCGIDVRPLFAQSDLPYRIGGEVRDFDGRQFVRPRKAIKVMCRPIQIGFAAAMFATDQAAASSSTVDPDRFGTLYGSDAFYAEPEELAPVFRRCIDTAGYHHDQWGSTAMREIQPLWMLQYLPNMVASHISIALDARGPSNTICQGEASSSLACIEAADLIARDWADVMVAGGTGAPLMTTGMIYRGTSRLSRRVDQPEKACRPFDQDRDGMVLGEGGGAVVLESEAHARARGAPLLARLLGWHRGFHQPCSPQFADAIERVIRHAIESAGIAVTDIGHINAHGASTIQDDVYEATAIARVLPHVPVIALKGNIGNLGACAGTVELIASVNAMQSGQLPPVLNCDRLDARCPINVVRSVAAVPQGKAALVLNFASTGQIVALVLGPP